MTDLAQLKPTDDDVLFAIRPEGCATYVVRNRLHAAGFKVETPWVLRRLKRLEAAGWVERVPSSYLVMISWRALQAQQETSEDE